MWLRLLRVRTSLWVIKTFTHFRIDLFTFLLFSPDSNLLHSILPIFSLVSALSQPLSLSRSLISVNYSPPYSIIERMS